MMLPSHAERPPVAIPADSDQPANREVAPPGHSSPHRTKTMPDDRLPGDREFGRLALALLAICVVSGLIAGAFAYWRGG
jgi:hypothetical protein